MPKAVPEIVGELLAELTQAGKSKFYLRDLRIRLGAFAKAHQCPLATVTGKDIGAYIKTLNGKGRYRNNVLNDIGTLCGYAKSQGYVHPDYEGTSNVTRYVVTSKEVEVFTPSELEAMLRAGNSQVQLALALTSFAGVRGAELGRLTWDDIRFDLGCIRISAVNAKTKIRRVPPITENLRAWLMLHKSESGPVVDYKNVYNQFLKVAKQAEVKWKRNAHRHGFVSYRTALIKNLDQVSLEAGHSKKQLLANYFQVVGEANAKAWFSIYPPKKNQQPESDSNPDAEIGRASCRERG